MRQAGPSALPPLHKGRYGVLYELAPNVPGMRFGSRLAVLRSVTKNSEYLSMDEFGTQLSLVEVY